MIYIPDNTIHYSYNLTVEEKHLDQLLHVNNVVYLQWVNDISEKHWGILAGEDLKKKYFWVVLKHELEYLSQALLGDEITLVTYIGESKGVKSVRHVDMYKGDTPLLRAASTWCLIDANSQKPVRIKNDILDLLIPDK